MNVNSQPLTQAIKDWLVSAGRRLAEKGIDSAPLDAEIILAHTLKTNRTYLHAHPEETISMQQYKIANSYLDQRTNRIPIAYIIGYKEFYGHEFIVTRATLVPRPESEDIITILGQILQSPNRPVSPIKLVDVGTGSGCLGITAKLVFPELDVTLIDISNEALKVAERNAKKLSAKVLLQSGDLLKDYLGKPNIIIANLPYVDRSWKRSPETMHEPDIALFADNHGLSIINRLVKEADSCLSHDGILIIEADPIQHDSIIELAKKYSLILDCRLSYILSFKLANLGTDAVKK